MHMMMYDNLAKFTGGINRVSSAANKAALDLKLSEGKLPKIFGLHEKVALKLLLKWRKIMPEAWDGLHSFPAMHVYLCPPETRWCSG